MIQKKICLLGSFSVGKTSLIRRYVEGVFSDKYLTTIGVKIDKKIVHIGREDVLLMLWDLAGEDEFYKIKTSFLRGASGYILVVDGARSSTLDKAIELQHRATDALGDVPFELVINKADLKDFWDIDMSKINELAAAGWSIFETSAKTGDAVDEMFTRLSRRMV